MNLTIEDQRSLIDTSPFRRFRDKVASSCDPVSALRWGGELIRGWCPEVLRDGSSNIGPRWGHSVPFSVVEWVDVDGAKSPSHAGDGYTTGDDERVTSEELRVGWFSVVDSYLRLEAQHFEPVPRPCGTVRARRKPKYTLDHLLECGCDTCHGEALRRLQWLEETYSETPDQRKRTAQTRPVANIAHRRDYEIDSNPPAQPNPWHDLHPDDTCTLAEACVYLGISEGKERYMRTGGKQGQPDPDWEDVPFYQGRRLWCRRVDVVEYVKKCVSR